MSRGQIFELFSRQMEAIVYSIIHGIASYTVQRTAFVRKVQSCMQSRDFNLR